MTQATRDAAVAYLTALQAHATKAAQLETVRGQLDALTTALDAAANDLRATMSFAGLPLAIRINSNVLIVKPGINGAAAVQHATADDTVG